MFRSRLLSLILALSLGSSSCWMRKSKSIRVFAPPPPKPRPAIITEVPQVPSAPDIKGDSQPELSGDIFATMPPAGPPPAVPPPRPPAPPPLVAAPPPAPAPHAPPPPRLGQIFTAEQLREYNRALDDS